MRMSPSRKPKNTSPSIQLGPSHGVATVTSFSGRAARTAASGNSPSGAAVSGERVGALSATAASGAGGGVVTSAAATSGTPASGAGGLGVGLAASGGTAAGPSASSSGPWTGPPAFSELQAIAATKKSTTLELDPRTMAHQTPGESRGQARSR